ncbi:MAG: hypothetical protein M3139_05315 [Bacteroidota bacterium]|nr:hypothetical protein [Bacteroidota bacterium]
MKTLFISVSILLSLYCSAQDNYEYQDTRRKNESFARLPKTEIRADLSTFTLSGIDEAVGKTELKKIPFTKFGDDFMHFEGDGVTAAITLAPFNPAKHKLDYDEKYLIRIDRKTYYGNFGKVPKTYISRIVLTDGADSITIPPAAYFDLYNVNLTYTDKGTVRSRNGIYKSPDGHRIYLYIFCKDATGSYEVTWIIQDKKYVRRVLDYGFM